MLRTGPSALFTASIASSIAPRGSPWNPVPSSASTITAPPPSTSLAPAAAAPGASTPSQGSPSGRSGGSPGRRSRFARASPSSSCGGAQQAGRNQAVSPVVSLAADNGDRPVRGQPLDPAGYAGSRPLHEIEPRHAALLDRPAIDRAHLLGVRERCEPVGECCHARAPYSTVTVLARLRGWSTFRPRRRAIW